MCVINIKNLFCRESGCVSCHASVNSFVCRLELNKCMLVISDLSFVVGRLVPGARSDSGE